MELSGEAIVHGRTYESIAVEKFESLSNLKVSHCGLFINPKYPFLAASPDGVIGSKAVIEVKCPFNGRNMKVQPGKFFSFLTFDGTTVTLKKNHSYFYQIQGQLAISRRDFCDFVVYSHTDRFVEKIFIVEHFLIMKFFQSLNPSTKMFSALTLLNLCNFAAFVNFSV